MRSTPMTPAALRELWERAGIKPLRVYPNPTRSDGVFVAEDMPLEPTGHGLDGSPHYPAVPRKAWGFGMQMEHDKAEAIVAALNAHPLLLDVVEAAKRADAVFGDCMNIPRCADRETPPCAACGLRAALAKLEG